MNIFREICLAHNQNLYMLVDIFPLSFKSYQLKTSLVNEFKKGKIFFITERVVKGFNIGYTICSLEEITIFQIFLLKNFASIHIQIVFAATYFSYSFLNILNKKLIKKDLKKTWRPLYSHFDFVQPIPVLHSVYGLFR